ncbi:hypothetical protein Vi05172_g13720 [Venturia inaequalis]|nr:hypothetical protein Vi05172_g13720 [Venturia inaequalis]
MPLAVLKQLKEQIQSDVAWEDMSDARKKGISYATWMEETLWGVTRQGPDKCTLCKKGEWRMVDGVREHMEYVCRGWSSTALTLGKRLGDRCARCRAGSKACVSVSAAHIARHAAPAAAAVVVKPPTPKQKLALRVVVLENALRRERRRRVDAIAALKVKLASQKRLVKALRKRLAKKSN